MKKAIVEAISGAGICLGLAMIHPGLGLIAASIWMLCEFGDSGATSGPP